MDEGLLEQHDRHAPYDDQQDVEPEALCSFEHQIRFAGRPAEQEARDRAALYNAAAALTLSVAVLFSYAVLFVLVLVAAGFFL